MRRPAHLRRLCAPAFAALVAVFVAAQPDLRRGATSPPAGAGSAADLSGPVYYLVGSAEEGRSLVPTLALGAEDRVLVLTAGPDADRELFALAALNHRRMDGGQPPIVVRDLRERTP